MTQQICYIDESGQQALRDLTEDEQIEFDARIAAAPAAIRASVWEAIKARRDRCKWDGVQVDGKWFHSDDQSRIQHLGLVLMGVGIPGNLLWKTMDGTFVPMTQALAGQVFAAVATLDIAAFTCAENHRSALSFAEEPATYDFSTGWPAGFGDTP